ncbi:hypothetical protein GCM10011344_22910 [Dokdonia pacifica]|uniref:Acetyltransferase (GNAT) domain-containing protein n=1 Tax=Dokdonia pacifica TaxID=1627892 RepID=A0A238WIN2_9FLAO|nr:GNAT family N-acetyltransferase [Dokdonia pacifica]GGG21530.1 hypothetical protein GCM10011344_22910 [Dokdonia pacifica]SNR46446.1 Acetyltransferase (GNAT) domain-containing protein [Dokdonia pacifica]
MSDLKVTYYTTVQEVSDTVFETLACNHTLYFTKEFLYAFEKANPKIEYCYLVLSQDNEVVSLAILQRMSVAIDNAQEHLPFSERIARSLQCYISARKIHTIVCGNVFLSGNYGVIIKDEIPQNPIYKKVAQEIKKVHTKKKASVFFFKDFTSLDIPVVSEVEKHQFQPFAVEPNMCLSIQEEWTDFDQYKASLKSKYRVKVNKADKKSAPLTIRSFESEDIDTHRKELQQLYCNITDRALFKTIDLEIETYRLLKLRFRESVLINTYWFKDRIVGFATAFMVENRVDAHFIGIDYDYNKELSIYPRILNDYVRLGIETKAKEVNFGRTSSEIKSTLGAVPENLTCYVRHRRTVATLLFKPLVRQIKMKEYKQHTPFKI